MGAPLNPVPQVLRIFEEGFVDTEDVYKWGNVYHIKYTGSAPANSDCAAFATDISTSWGSHMAPECPAPTTLTSVTVTDLTSDSAGEGAWGGSIPGTRGDDSIPANAAMLVSYLAGTRYRGGHPRTYLYVGGNADLEGAAKWSSAFTAEAEAHFKLHVTDMASMSSGGTAINSFGFVRFRGQYLPNGGPPHYYLDTPIYTPIALGSIFTKQEIASQRRRVGRRRS